MPVIPLRDVVVFPHMIYPLMVGRSFTVKALQEAMVRDKQVLLVAQRSAAIDAPKADDLFEYGVVARILQVMKMPNGTLKVLVEGMVRAHLQSISHEGEFITVKVGLISRLNEKYDRETEAMSRAVSEQFSEYVRLNRRIPDEVLVAIASIESYDLQADTIAAHLLQKIEVKQRLLETTSVKEQLIVLSEVLKEEIEILKIEHKIDGSIRESMSRGQREIYLQQQLKAIKDELGQGDDGSADVEDLYTKLEVGDFPDPVVAKAEEEIRKLAKMHPYSAEASVVRSYVEWLLALPWNIHTDDRTNFTEVKSILDGDHYGLEKPKQRILEHLAVIKLASKVKGPILCLVGPPGVGKTSVGRSIANAMDRKFVRMSLGGIHDEAEIRGHRRTYIGALPGRIIQSLKKAEATNPVFLLDEVDKIGKDFRGDPAAALLEVLDPEQNNSFCDNYLEVEYDLSDVLFVTTANSTSGVPAPLRDRMEIIRLPGYLDFEKVAIARDYLLPKLIKEIGLDKIKVTSQDEALHEIIRYYTREAGVRELERQLGSLLRKVALTIVEGKRLRKLTINKTQVHKLLGQRKYIDTNIRTQPTVGYAVALAWTETGGEVMPVEAVPMKGKAKLTLTGSLGEVMRESATAALSYIRNHATRLGLEAGFFDNMELHIHIPEGAVPKDGPSAGVTLMVAMLSSLTGIPSQTNLAMTGEITLSGDVLPVGGLNEKLLAAKRQGITRILLPARNRKDIIELPAELLEGLDLKYMHSVGEVLRIALEELPPIKAGVSLSRRPSAPLS